jgi:hypothetical protein
VRGAAAARTGAARRRWGIGAVSVVDASDSTFGRALVDLTIAYVAIATGAIVAVAGIVSLIPGGILWSRSSGALERSDPLRPRVSIGATGLVATF